MKPAFLNHNGCRKFEQTKHGHQFKQWCIHATDLAQWPHAVSGVYEAASHRVLMQELQCKFPITYGLQHRLVYTLFWSIVGQEPHVTQDITWDSFLAPEEKGNDGGIIQFRVIYIKVLIMHWPLAQTLYDFCNSYSEMIDEIPVKWSCSWVDSHDLPYNNAKVDVDTSKHLNPGMLGDQAIQKPPKEDIHKAGLEQHLRNVKTIGHTQPGLLDTATGTQIAIARVQTNALGLLVPHIINGHDEHFDQCNTKPSDLAVLKYGNMYTRTIWNLYNKEGVVLVKSFFSQITIHGGVSHDASSGGPFIPSLHARR